MKRLIVTACLAACLLPSAFADEPAVNSKTKPNDAVKPWASQEAFWFPLRHDAKVALDHVQYHFRRNEEKAAAAEIEKAICWLEYAADHGEAHTKKNLRSAINSLNTLMVALKKGDIIGATAVNSALSRAGHAFAEWHLFRSKESLANDETARAAENLATAATYLQQAANSAKFEYGGMEPKLFDRIHDKAKQAANGVSFDTNTLGDELSAVEESVKRLGFSLQSYDEQ
jgi:hypothetical protein